MKSSDLHSKSADFPICIKIQLLQISMQRILPGRKRGKAVCSQLALIEAAVKRAGCLGYAVLCGRDRRYVQAILFVLVMSKLGSLTEDFLCKIIPADILAGVRRMIVAVFIGFDHINEQAGKVVGVGRCTDLVADDTQRSELPAKVQHRFFRIPMRYGR